MTFDAAINSLSDGRATRYATWGGYVFRTDVVPDDFSITVTYSVNDLVRYGNKTYICAIATGAGEWNEANWLRADSYSLTFRKRLNKAGNIPDDTVYTYVPKVLTSGNTRTVSYAIDYTGGSCEGSNGMLTLDGAFLQALRGPDWTLGRATDFETARIGTGDAW